MVVDFSKDFYFIHKKLRIKNIIKKCIILTNSAESVELFYEPRPFNLFNFPLLDKLIL